MYRIMVEGEDGLIFCYEDEVLKRHINAICIEATSAYPTSIEIWSEKMNTQENTYGVE